MHSVLAAIRTEATVQDITRHATELGLAASVRTSTSAEAALATLVEWPADVVLVNSVLVAADHVRFTKRVQYLRPHAAVVLVGLADSHMAAAAVAAGAGGIVRSGGDGDALIAACVNGLLKTRDGGCPELPRQRDALVRHPVSQRELQVLRAMSEGYSNAEIARRLYISEDTVKTHARRIYRKLGARDRAHAVAAAFRAGLVA
ncbi:MAG: response regulator transcription factor [Stackebrandtia sp.]